MTIKYDTDATNIVIDKAIISEDFFKLSIGNGQNSSKIY